MRRATRRTLCAALLSAGALLGASHGANAQFAFEEEILPPRVVAWRLADRGFSGVSRPRFNGRVYVVDAVSPTGAPVRLFVDPAAGAIVGRQPLGAPETYARLERPGAGFGWTEDEPGPQRVGRPMPSESPPAMRPQRRPAQALRREFGPEGLNPEGPVRPDTPRRVARTAAAPRQPEIKPALRTVPDAPPQTGAPLGATQTDGKPDAPPATRSAAIDRTTPASATPAETGPAKPAASAVAAAAKPPQPDWKDPPTDKKPVRVIGGATVVPGASDPAPAAVP